MLNQNWERALGKSLDHFMLRGRAGGHKAWPAAQATVNFIGGVMTPPLATGLDVGQDNKETNTKVYGRDFLTGMLQLIIKL